MGDCLVKSVAYAEMTGFTYALGSGPIEILHEPGFLTDPPCDYPEIVTSRWFNGSEFDPCCVNFTYDGTKMKWTADVTDR